MNKFSIYQYLLILVILVVGSIYALPNLYPTQPSIQVAYTDSGRSADQPLLNELEDILQDSNTKYEDMFLRENKIVIKFNDVDTQLSSKTILQNTLLDKVIIALFLEPSTPQWLKDLGANPVKLGLDLSGGVHFLLEVDIDTAQQGRLELLLDTYRKSFKEERIKFDDSSINDLRLVFEMSDNQSYSNALKRFRDDSPLINGVQYIITEKPASNILMLEYTDVALREIRDYAVGQNLTTLRNRVNELGVSEPIVQRQGANRIVVQLPGVQDTARAKEILGAVATIEFRMVDEKNDVQTAIQSGKTPTGSKIYKFKDGRPLLLKTNVITTGENINDASSSMDENNQPSVSIVLDSSGGRSMLDTTKEFLGYRMAVVFIENQVETVMEDGVAVKKRTKTQDIINAATIQGTFSNRFQITGLDSAREATNLALLLRAGSLSAPVEIIEERTIGPSLGADNIQKGLISVLVGFALVLIFMAWRYRVFGLVANLALTLNLITIISILSLIQATLTLPGIAGIVLTVGMAVDANVLIFERIKEEMRSSKNIQKAISSGYEKALLTIADANITTLIASIVLFSFGTGPIKGFAVTLTIGIITSMFTAIIVSRAIINLIYGGKKVEELAI